MKPIIIAKIVDKSRSYISKVAQQKITNAEIERYLCMSDFDYLRPFLGDVNSIDFCETAMMKCKTTEGRGHASLLYQDCKIFTCTNPTPPSPLAKGREREGLYDYIYSRLGNDNMVDVCNSVFRHCKIKETRILAGKFLNLYQQLRRQK